MFPTKSTAAGRYLLFRAAEYRERIESDSPGPTERIDFPRHQRDYRWTESQLEQYGQFVSLKVYKLHLTFAEGGWELTSTERELAFEVRVPSDATASTDQYIFEERCV